MNDKTNPRGEMFWLLLVVASFLLGHLMTKAQSLEKIQAADNAGVKKEANILVNPPSVKNQPTPLPSPAGGLASADNVPPVVAKDHLRGDKQAKITLVEYSDFECPFCKRFHPTMKKILEEYPDKVNWVYRHFPLPFHTNALPAALAAECADELGGNTKFWQYTDGIFADPSTLSSETISAVADKIGLDKSKFSACLEDKKYQKKVEDQQAGGQKAGVNGTPGTILINNQTGKTQLISGALPFEEIKKTIDSALAE